jgi:tetratricopeptide (TPR) repeat protein
MRLRLLSVFLSASVANADIVVTKSLIHTGQIMRVEADGVVVKLAIGELTVPKVDIVRVDAEKPAGLDAALAATKAGKFQEAVNGLKPAVDHYAGLPIPWVQDALVRLGDAYIGVKDFAAAKRTFDAFKKLYPTSPLARGLDVKYARVLFEQKDYAKAIEALQSFLDPMLKRDYLTDEQEAAVSEALLLLGDCQQATNASEAALDNYLRVVTLFDVDPDRTTEAKAKADDLKKRLAERR